MPPESPWCRRASCAWPRPREACFATFMACSAAERLKKPLPSFAAPAPSVVPRGSASPSWTPGPADGVPGGAVPPGPWPAGPPVFAPAPRSGPGGARSAESPPAGPAAPEAALGPPWACPRPGAAPERAAPAERDAEPVPPAGASRSPNRMFGAAPPPEVLVPPAGDGPPGEVGRAVPAESTVHAPVGPLDRAPLPTLPAGPPELGPSDRASPETPPAEAAADPFLPARLPSIPMAPMSPAIALAAEDPPPRRAPLPPRQPLPRRRP